jgi:hypothetical protein
MPTENWITRVFLSEVKTQCSFAMIAYSDIASAIRRLQQSESPDFTDSLRIFYSVQACLTACANISKLLWPKTTPNPGETKDHVRRRRNRADQLWHLLGATSQTPLNELKDKRLRNYFEHFDERLDEWALTSPNHILMTRCSGTPGSFQIAGMGPSDTMGYLDLATSEVTFQDLKISLVQMHAAVQHLFKRIDELQQSGVA